MQLKMIVETCSYEMEEDEGIRIPEVTEVITEQDFMIPVVFDEQKKHYVPVEMKQMLRPYVHLIELAVQDNMDYAEIAMSCGMLREFMDKIEEYEPTHEEYVIDLLAKCLYDVGCDKIIPELGNVMYRLLYVLEENDEI